MCSIVFSFFHEINQLIRTAARFSRTAIVGHKVLLFISVSAQLIKNSHGIIQLPMMRKLNVHIAVQLMQVIR